MVEITLATLTSPVSESAPCGPDLDVEGDPDFLNFMARAEGLLPASFFSGPEGRPFDRTAIDFAAEVAAAEPLLARTRDLRLLVLLTKFAALRRDLNTFAVCISAIAQLLESWWEQVHPRGDGGDFAIRSALIETLNDSAPIVIPLQYMPLVQSRRFGPISYRNLMFASGEATPREGEEFIDQVNIERAFAEAELPNLVETRATFEAMRNGFLAIQKCCREKAGDQPVNLDKSVAQVDKIFTLLNSAITKRDPAAGVATPSAGKIEPAATATATLSRIRSGVEAAAALAAVDAYFCHYEPSSPALLLVRQVRQLVGKSLLEVLQILIPGQLSDAKFHLDGSQAFTIPIESLASVAAAEPVAEMPTEPVASSSEGECSAQSDTAKANSRQEAFALLEQIAGYYRVVEPSSPISLILDRARSYANQDFLTILKGLLAKPASE